MTRTSRLNPEIAGPETSGAQRAMLARRRIDAEAFGCGRYGWNIVFKHPSALLWRLELPPTPSLA